MACWRRLDCRSALLHKRENDVAALLRQTELRDKVRRQSTLEQRPLRCASARVSCAGVMSRMLPGSVRSDRAGRHGTTPPWPYRSYTIMLKQPAILRRRVIALAAVIAPPLRPARAQGQDYPNHPVRIVVPSPAGGPTDVVARLLAPGLGEGWV